MVLQKLKKDVKDEFSKAEYYYSIISVVNNLNLTEREIQLVAFTSVKGNITYANVREEFCKKYNTSSATINNIISKLKKLKIFVKEEGKVKVNPVIVLNFSSPVILQIQLGNE
jgi:predicted HTH transcriptional regulator